MARSSKSTITVGKSGYATGVTRTDEEWDALFAKTILPALQRGVTMTVLRAEYGRSECIRQAARRAGYESTAAARRGEKGFSAIKVKGVQSKVVAKRLTDARKSGDSWNTLRLRTGLDAAELRTVLRKHGQDELATGRVITSQRGLARKEAAEKAAAEAAAKKAARKPRAPRKPKVKVAS